MALTLGSKIEKMKKNERIRVFRVQTLWQEVQFEAIWVANSRFQGRKLYLVRKKRLFDATNVTKCLFKQYIGSNDNLFWTVCAIVTFKYLFGCITFVSKFNSFEGFFHDDSICNHSWLLKHFLLMSLKMPTLFKGSKNNRQEKRKIKSRKNNIF